MTENTTCVLLEQCCSLNNNLIVVWLDPTCLLLCSSINARPMQMPRPLLVSCDAGSNPPLWLNRFMRGFHFDVGQVTTVKGACRFVFIVARRRHYGGGVLGLSGRVSAGVSPSAPLVCSALLCCCSL